MTTPPRRSPRPVLWRAAAKVAAVALSAGDAYVIASLVPSLWHTFTFTWPAVLFDLFSGLIAVALVGAVGWLAWRLWARWNAITVRVVVAVTLAVVILGAASWLSARVEPFVSQQTDTATLGVLALVGLIGGAVAYRRMTPAVLRSAGLVDVAADAFGRSAGHVRRTRLFCDLLGLQTGATAWSIVHAVGWDVPQARTPEWVAGVAIAGPVLLGYATWRLTRRWLLPPGRRPVPAGGFPVVVHSRP